MATIIVTPWIDGGVSKRLVLVSGQFSATVKTSRGISGIEALPSGIAWDGINTPWTGNADKKLYVQFGQFLATLKTSLAVGTIENNPQDIAWDGTNTPWTGSTDKKLYLQSGQFSVTMKTSLVVDTIDSFPTGIAWDGTNTPWTGSTDDKLYLQSGQFSATLKTSLYVGAVDLAPTGIAWDGVNTPWSGDEANKLYLQSGKFSATLKTSRTVTGGTPAPLGISWSKKEIFGPNQLQDFTNVADTAITGTPPVLQLIASANDASYVNDDTNSTHTGVARFTWADMPTDFGTMTDLTVRLRYFYSSTPVNNTWNSLTAQVVRSDGTTPLTDEITVAGPAITTTTPVNSQAINFTGIDLTANKATWDDSLVLLRFSITRTKGGEAFEERVSAAEISGVYAVSTDDPLRVLTLLGVGR
jgi:hypothetical protein